MMETPAKRLRTEEEEKEEEEEEDSGQEVHLAYMCQVQSGQPAWCACSLPCARWLLWQSGQPPNEEFHRLWSSL